MKIMRILAAGVLALAISSIYAQGGASGGRGQGGPGGAGGARQGGPGGQGGMRMGGMGRGGGRLLLNASVQKELKMTKAQIDKAQKTFGDGAGGGAGGGPGGGGTGGGGAAGGRGGPGGGGPGGGGMTDAQREQRRLDQEKQIKSVINATQFARYQQITLQIGGAGALTRPDIAKQVGISDKQIKQIRDIQQKQFESMRGGMGGPGGGGAAGGRGQGGGGAAGGRGPGGPPAGGANMMAQFQKMREETNKKVMAVLTPQQKKKWESMLGSPFKLQM